jgi:NADH:ubiquinone oxidoreductase subunit 5 (subunit L)/multisubunit Na+/H+ antiporter MnhA subunit
LKKVLIPVAILCKAGVYLFIRFNHSFSYWLNVILLLVSVLTIFMAGLGANFEFDLKKIIALSTLSQLGLMIYCWDRGLESRSEHGCSSLVCLLCVD